MVFEDRVKLFLNNKNITSNGKILNFFKKFNPTYFAFALSFLNSSFSQCTYTQTGNDSWGDGWHGATLTITDNMTSCVVVTNFTVATGSTNSNNL